MIPDVGHQTGLRIAAATKLFGGTPEVPVVPIRTTETWLLLDEAAIRLVAGDPRERSGLDLPAPRTAGGAAARTPPEAALTAASGTTGRRRSTAAERFPRHRGQLLERLDRSGPVGQLPAFRALVRDVETAAEQLRGLSSR